MTENSPLTLAEKIVGLMVEDDDRMWERHYGALIDHVAEWDDLTFVRAAKEAAPLIADFNLFVQSFYAGFGDGAASTITPQDITDESVELARIPKEIRCALMRGVAARLRGDAAQNGQAST